MKKALSILLAVFMVASVLPFSLTASAFTSGYYTYSVSSGEATITGISTSISGSVTIPSNLGGYPVTSFGDSAFSNCTGLTSITIPDSVTSIGDSAFEGCTGLTSITIPDSVTSIGDWAFSDCTVLTSITIGNSVKSIGRFAFFYCTGLTSITVEDGNTVYHSKNNCIIETDSKTLVFGCKNSIIPSDGSVTSIGWGAFEGCTGLTSITIPDSVTSIGGYAFNYCTGLTSITIPNSVKSIGDYAFDRCTGLTSITIPNSVTSFGWYAFEGCTGLTSITVEDGNTVYHSKNNCLIETESKTLISGCKNSIIPTDGSVTSIQSKAFYGYTGLTSITIPNSVTSIGAFAFYYCTGLTSITIPNSVTSIGGGAFSECTGLEDVWYTGSEEDKSDISIGSYNDDLLNATWHYNVPTPDTKYGFVTDDEEISTADALAILQASVGIIQFTDAQKTAGDVDGDGEINVTDALLVLQYAVGKINKFPVEG